MQPARRRPPPHRPPFRRFDDAPVLRLSVATVEDLVVAKLEWAELGESPRQAEDVAGILRFRRDEMDVEHVEGWVEKLDLAEV